MCTSYCDLFLSHGHREFDLNVRYCFECTCEVCSKDELEKEKIDEFREKYRKVDEQILEEGTLDPKRGLQLVQKALQIMTKGLPFVPRFVAKNAFAGFQFALASGNNLDLANQFIQLAWKARLIEGGKDFEETKEMFRYMNHPESHPLYR